MASIGLEVSVEAVLILAPDAVAVLSAVLDRADDPHYFAERQECVMSTLQAYNSFSDRFAPLLPGTLVGLLDVLIAVTEDHLLSAQR
ncbi:hypothetical protein [Nocardia sp. NBC_00403]|uniref:hypothetical protein n=1 Tax=Nocardia sp. NBC_00403 TaxID=2975990 RepID=UPI002E22A6A1